MNILYVTTIGSTMSFFIGLIKQLQEDGHCVDLATNEMMRTVPGCYREWGCKVHPISCTRNPFSPGSLKAILQIRKLVKENDYDIVHCHTPVAAMCTRLACIGARKRGTKVYYTAHGFHFFKGAPLKNWLIYYPVEKLCSYFTDVLITINKEDYALAQRKMKAEKIVYIPGVGLDVQKYKDISVDKVQKRKELDIPENAVLLLSVGELNENKNHQVIIRALAQLGNSNVHYAIAGRGPKKKELEDLARELGLERQVHLLGYRKDIGEICKCADAFCLPSYREGLGLAALEAMACGLPLITSNIHGINDYSENSISGYKTAPTDAEGFAEIIRTMLAEPDAWGKMGLRNMQTVEKFDISKIVPEMLGFYGIKLRMI